jgi:hypothetical protein
MTSVSLAGKMLYFQPFEFKQMKEADLWDEEAFLSDIRSGKFATILLYEPVTWDSRKERWTPAQLAAIDSSYRMVNFLADTAVLVPK